MKCLFVLHVLGKCIIKQRIANVPFLYLQNVPENNTRMDH